MLSFKRNQKTDKKDVYRILVADMCFHQVMAESMYHVFKLIGRTDILANESNMDWPKTIPKDNIKLIYQSKKGTSFFKRRFYRLIFLINLLLVKNKYSHIIVTTGIEYSPKSIRTISYFLFFLLSRSNIKIISVVHNIDFWNTEGKNDIKTALKRKILCQDPVLACLSNNLKERLISITHLSNQVIVLPFLTISKTELDRQNFSHVNNINNSLTVVFQGTVNYKRKNCSTLLEAVKMLPESKRDRLRIIFQGPPIYPADFHFLKEISKIVKCNWRDYFLSNSEMTALLKDSHIFISPIDKSLGYGITKESGIFFDAIRYQRPAIVTEEVCSKEFLPFIQPFKNKYELSNILKTMDKKNLLDLSSRLKEISQYYTSEYYAGFIRSTLFR